MKTTKRILAMLFVAATMVFAACGDKDNENDNPQPVNMDLSGRAWQGAVSSNYTYMGLIQMNINANITMHFTISTEGEALISYILEVPSAPDYNQNNEQTSAFTYTFDGSKLILTPTDEEQGEDSLLGEMNYNSANNTFVMPIPEGTYEGINLREALGTDQVVFYEIDNSGR